MVTRLELNENTRAKWEKILHDQRLEAPFFTFRWHRLWFEILGRDWEPYILLASENVIAPFARKNDTIMFSGGEETADYLDLIGEDEMKHTSWAEIMNDIKEDGVRNIKLVNIPQTSPTLEYFSSLAKQGTSTDFSDNTSITIKKEDTTPRISLPESWNQYLSTLKSRYRKELKRKIRKFENENPSAEVTQNTNPAEGIEHLLRLMHMNSEKNTFLTPEREEFFRGFPEAFSETMTLLLLNVDGEVVAALLLFLSEHSQLSYNSGFNRNAYSGAGFYLKAMSIKKAIEEGYKEYNFLQGGERYKYELGGQDFWVYSVDLSLVA